MLILLKSHVAGYVRKDGTAVRPHEDRRRKKEFGSQLANLAKRAQAGLSHEARMSVEAWNVNWSTGRLEEAFQKDSAVAYEIRAAFEPVRAKLRELYGDTVPLYRGEKAGPEESEAGRKLFSWTPVAGLARQFAMNYTHDVPPAINDNAIKQALAEYERTGFVSFRGYKYKRSNEYPGYYDIYDQRNNYVTDGDDLQAHLRSGQADRDEHIADLKARGHVYQAHVPVDDLVWIPVGANLHEPEIIAMYNPRTQPAAVMAKSVLFVRRP